MARPAAAQAGPAPSLTHCVHTHITQHTQPTGVPAFFRWLSEKYPKTVIDMIEQRPHMVDGVAVRGPRSVCPCIPPVAVAPLTAEPHPPPTPQTDYRYPWT